MFLFIIIGVCGQIYYKKLTFKIKQYIEFEYVKMTENVYRLCTFAPIDHNKLPNMQKLAFICFDVL